jgi:hypothetical protein
MKTFLLSSVAALMLAGAANATLAQSPRNVFDGKGDYISINESVLPHGKAINTDFVSKKAMKDLSKSFKNSAGASWEQSTDGVVATFNDGDIKDAIYYDKKGNWQATMKSYFESSLNKNVRAIVKQKYFDDKITYIQEIVTVNSQDTPTYIVHLEGATDFKLVRVQDGAMDVLEQYNKN